MDEEEEKVEEASPPRQPSLEPKEQKASSTSKAADTKKASTSKASPPKSAKKSTSTSKKGTKGKKKSKKDEIDYPWTIDVTEPLP